MALAAVPEAEQAGEGTDGPETGAEPLGDGAVETGDATPPDDAPPEPPAEEPKPPKLLQEPLPGDWATISDTFGGATPDMAEIRLLGGKMPIDGSFAKGTEIDLIVRVRVTGVLGQDLEDAYGTKGGTVRRHMARMISVRRMGK